MIMNRQTLEAVALARTGFDRSCQHSSEGAGGRTAEPERLHTLFAVAERYPDLKANRIPCASEAHFRTGRAQSPTAAILHDDVATYNTRIAQLPEVFLARQMSCGPGSCSGQRPGSSAGEMSWRRAQGTA